MDGTGRQILTQLGKHIELCQSIPMRDTVDVARIVNAVAAAGSGASPSTMARAASLPQAERMARSWSPTSPPSPGGAKVHLSAP